MGGQIADWQIRRRTRHWSDVPALLKGPMIEPFVDYDQEDQGGCISYGLTSYGYDLRLGTKFKLFTNALAGIIDPKNLDPKTYVDIETADRLIIPPMSYILGVSVEYLRIPRDIHCLCVGKSTYARSCVIANLTPLEAEWEGFVTLEISNPTTLPVYVYPNEGIVQVIFFQASNPSLCERSYEDKKGKYQRQQGIQTPLVKGTPRKSKV
jgi:dCTP deaminase